VKETNCRNKWSGTDTWAAVETETLIEMHAHWTKTPETEELMVVEEEKRNWR
jgi:hypothetical protein